MPSSILTPAEELARWEDDGGPVVEVDATDDTCKLCGHLLELHWTGSCPDYDYALEHDVQGDGVSIIAPRGMRDY